MLSSVVLLGVAFASGFAYAKGWLKVSVSSKVKEVGNEITT